MKTTITKQEGTTFAGQTVTNQHWIGDDVCRCDEICTNCGKRKKYKPISFGDNIRCCK